ncbi:MAG: 4-alpha-glucanotransferase [Gammaproteobacteria bacterium]|nr:MAG: 4-alpha-glucanotransferase [Gammaproteobacteria bacterium]
MDLIEKLADLVGFHRNYVNSFGEQVFANNGARRSLLTAMGYNLDNDNALNQSIDELSQNSWRTMLPATHIAQLEACQHTIEISLPQAKLTELSWQIITEDQKKLSKTLTISSLTLLDSANFNDEKFNKYQLLLPNLAQGYHQLSLTYGNNKASCHLIYAPKTCFSPQEACSEKMWGLAAQLYSLHSDNSWGIGDFGDLNKLVEQSASHGVAAIGLNPLHPLFQNNPAHRSPYSPTSRCFLNTIYIDVTKVANFKTSKAAQQKYHSDDFQQRLRDAQNTQLVDYPAASSLKFEILELLYQDFVVKELSNKGTLNKGKNKPSVNAKAFTQFKKNGGKDLFQLATFEALYEHFRVQDFNCYGWPNWPKAYQNSQSKEVLKFIKENSQRIDYFIFCQWLADQQLSTAAQTAKHNGMPVGLYLDLAVGCDGSGVDVWSDPDVYVAGAAVGAPPDATNALGQDWGLTPINPVALQEKGYLPLVKALRSNMQYAGALRIDHILGLMRQYWVAPGYKADQGVYITFPLEDILRIIALESRRNNCVVIGEDLGTVPDGFGDIMANAGLLSYKVLFFERWESGLFMRPETYPAQSMVTVSTHDLPTLSGWWTGKDLQWRQNLNLYPNEAMGNSDRQGRVGDRDHLMSALDDMNVIDMTNAPQQAPAKMNTELSLAVQKFLALAPSHIQLIPLEDMLEISEQVNIPGTINEHPNWLQKLPVSCENLWHTVSVKAQAQAMNIARPNNKVQLLRKTS